MGGVQSTHAKNPGASKNKTPCGTGELLLFDSEIPSRNGLALFLLLIAVKGLNRLLTVDHDDDINELIQRRREAFHRKAREDIDSKLKSIVDKVKKGYEHHPLHPSRPYGLTVEMEGLQRHIWDLIFVHVNDLNSIVSLREVCMMFRDLLESKYVAARLPGIAALCLERNFIPWEFKVSSWVPTVSSIRGLSNATKISVDELFDRGLHKSGEWFDLYYEYFRIELGKLPHFTFGASDAEQASLQRALDFLEVEGYSKDSFPMKTIMFNECRSDNLPLDLQNLRGAFQNCLEKIGDNITSFRYWTTNESPFNVYENLRRFVALMPNLEEMIVIFIRPGVGPIMNVGPFPSCPNLTRYAEGPHGFGFPFINEIFKANPTVEEVHLGETPSYDLEVKNLKKVLDTFQLKTFNCTCLPTIEFLEYRFPWALQLTVLTLWEATPLTSPVIPIPSAIMFKFMSSFKNLRTLEYMSSRIQYTGGYLNLPVLERLSWQIVPGFESLEFLTPVENLKWLELDVCSCPPEFRGTRKMMEFLGKSHIPALFPGLRKVRVKTDTIGKYKTFWES